MRINMNDIAARNRADGWSLDRTREGEWKLRRQTSTYRDYPVQWYGLLWPVNECDSDAEWQFEIRSYIDGSLLEKGQDVFYKAFQLIHGKR